MDMNLELADDGVIAVGLRKRSLVRGTVLLRCLFPRLISQVTVLKF
jgi:hypothetical protein